MASSSASPHQEDGSLIVKYAFNITTPTANYTLILISIVVIMSLNGFLFVRRNKPRGNDHMNKKKSYSVEKSSLTTKRRAPICPFSRETNFVVETAEHLPPTPLDLYDSWLNVDSIDFGKPLAARWLCAGLSGQDTPGMLRAGLRRMRNSQHFLVEEPFRIREELLMKKKALEDPKRFPLVFVAEPDSLEAQHEVLDLFLSFLPKRYPEHYVYNEKMQTILVKPIDQTFCLSDWGHRPLELCERIVQEDLVLMRPPRSTDKFDSYAMAAAAVVFSFDALPEKLGQPVEFLHAPVPGFEKHLRKTLNLTFASILKVEAPLWRNNWGISPSGELDKPLYGSNEAHAHRTVQSPTREQVRSSFLKVEYQTIRRLPKSGYLLFTVKTMADPLHSLEQVPSAAQCLAASIRGMSPSMRAYKGISDDNTCRVVLEYLDSIAERQQ